MKNIFVVNDDSVKSPGLSALVKNLEGKYNLTVVTTKHFKSWTAKAITYNKEVTLEEGRPTIKTCHKSKDQRLFF